MGRGFAKTFLNNFKKTTATVTTGDPNADSADVGRGVIKLSAIAALGAGAAGAGAAGGGAVSSGTAGSASGGGFFGGGAATGGLTGTAGIAPGAAGVGTAGSTIPFATSGISGGAISAGTAGGGAGFFGNTGGLTGQAGITPQVQQEPSFLQRLNSQRSNINRGRRLLNQQNQGGGQQRFNDERNRFLTESEQRQQQAALTGNPASISATGITTSGQLFSRSLQSALGAEDPREFRARAVQEATLEASQFQPGTAEFTQAATAAFANRGLTAEANNAQQQGLKAQLQVAQIDTQRQRARLLEQQADQAMEARTQALLGDKRLSLADLRKDSDGRKAIADATEELLRRNRDRVERGEKPSTGPEFNKELARLANFALSNPPQTETITRGDTGTSIAQRVTRPTNFSGVGQTQQGIGQPQAPQNLRGPLPPSAQQERVAAQQIQQATQTPVVEGQSVSPTVVRNASFSGANRVKPRVQPIRGEPPREKRNRQRAAREAQSEISAAIIPLNSLINEIQRTGPIFDANVTVPILGEVPVQDLVDSAVRRFANPAAGRGVTRQAADRKRLQGAYQEFISGLAKAASGATVSDQERTRFEQQAIDPTSLAGSNLGKQGLIQTYMRIYQGMIGKAQAKSDEFSTPITLPEFPPAIRRALREGGG